MIGRMGRSAQLEQEAPLQEGWPELLQLKYGEDIFQ